MENKPKQTAEESFYEQIDQTNPVTRGSTALVKISKLTSAQTAVEWLESKMPTAFKELTINKELFQQAKEMEKQQDKFTNAPIHDKKAIIEMMNKLHPKEMAEVVEFIKIKIETYGKK